MCFLGIHQWTKWKEIERGEIKTYDRQSKLTFTSGTFLKQERRCERCGKIELHTTQTEF